MIKLIKIMAFLFLGFICLFHTATAGTGRFAPPKTVNPIKYEVNGLSANTFSDRTLLYVSGKIKNTSFHPLQGYVIIRFQDSSKSELGYVETDLNQNLPLRPNELGAFEIIVNIKNEPNIQNVSVEFVSNRAN
nr:hypothetical protein [uncultured Desulfobacter sp.]